MARGDFPSSKQDQYMIRFPDGMRDMVKAAAETNGRSMNAEIIERLAASFASDDSLHYKLDAILERLERHG